MFTSRAEHRLLLRQDNADRRLMGYGHTLGLIDPDRHAMMVEKYSRIDASVINLKTKTIIVDERTQGILAQSNIQVDKNSKINAGKLLKRPEVRLGHVLELLNESIDEGIAPIVEMEIKYEGYINRDMQKIIKLEKMENRLIPETIDYDAIPGLRKEARDKLRTVHPRTLGQAMRISGVDPSAISILAIYIESTARKSKDVPRGT